jgi:hypothetical protein
MVRARKGRKNTWDVQLRGVKEPAVVRLYPGLLWCVTPLWLTKAQQKLAVDSVRRRPLGPRRLAPLK